MIGFLRHINAPTRSRRETGIDRGDTATVVWSMGNRVREGQMAFMTWTPAMSVGVDQLDDDHKGLIAVINDLAEESSGEARATVLRQSLVALRRVLDR